MDRSQLLVPWGLLVAWICWFVGPAWGADGQGAATDQKTEQNVTRPVKELVAPGESFLFQERPAFILWPAESLRRDPQPWVYYSPTLPGTPDTPEQWMHEQLLAAGIAVAGIDVDEAYGSPRGRAYFDAFYHELTTRRHFALRPCVLGRSRGGLWASSWVAENTDKCAGLAGIYPVFDFRSYPGIDKAASAYELSPEDLARRAAEFNPIDRVPKMAAAKIPVCIIHGDIDDVVPLEPNSRTLLRHYERAGVGDAVQLIVAQGQGHNYWEGFFRCQPLIDFMIARAREGAMTK